MEGRISASEYVNQLKMAGYDAFVERVGSAGAFVYVSAKRDEGMRITSNKTLSPFWDSKLNRWCVWFSRKFAK